MSDSSDELDLSNIYDLIKKSFAKAFVLLFKTVNFVLEKWKSITVLIILGILFGYFVSADSKPKQEAQILVRINFDLANYVYNEIELLNSKIKDSDSLFLSEIGFSENEIGISSLEIKPVINFKDIIGKYGSNGRYLEGLLKNVEFSEDAGEIWQTFNSDYNYHFLKFTLSSDASPKSIEVVVNYINNNTLLKGLTAVYIKSIEESIDFNSKTINQINGVLDSYKYDEASTSASNQIYIVEKDVNLGGLIQQKINMQVRNVNLKEELVLSSDILIAIGKTEIVEIKKGILSNKMILYPIAFVLLFLLFAGARRAFFSLKKLAEE
jgi:hypothetical protein